MKPQRNMTLELLKLLAAYMVVFIHVPFPGPAGEVIMVLARFAVPLFFLVSGFYSYQIPKEKILRRTRHIGTLLLVAVICYTLYNTAIGFLNDGVAGIASYFSEYTSRTALIELFLYNATICSTHLWYLPAMLYVYLLYYAATALRFKDTVVYILSGVLLLTHLVLSEGLGACGITMPVPVLRNFALMGLPFFGLGLLAKKYEDRLRRISLPIAAVCAAAGVALSLLSRFLLGKNELYLGTLLMVFSAVVVFIRLSDRRYPRAMEAITGCSTDIYIFHVMISSIGMKAYSILHLPYTSSTAMKILHPLLVCAVVTLLAYGLQWWRTKRSSEKKS